MTLRHAGTVIRRLLRLMPILAALLIALSAAPIAAQEEPPDPIIPSSGELNLLELINDLPLNDIDEALDHFPVPYVVVAQAGGGPPVTANNRAGAPTRVDADSSKATGLGGNDIQVEVNTELTPTPHLELEINRLGVAPFANDLTVFIAFPFDAFNSETLPGAPNLFIGYQTTAAGGAAGGIAPVSEVITFTPEILAGTTHTFTLGMATTGAANPLRFVAGHFDGTNLTGILNAAAMSAHVEPVPATIGITLSVDESALLAGPGGTESLFDIAWTASAASKVTFDYLEEESTPAGTSDYNTTLTFDQMPTSEHLTLNLDEAAGTLTLDHSASAVIGAITLLHERDDGLVITGIAAQVPTLVSLTIGLDGTATLDVNANTLDLTLLVTQDEGFLNTEDFLGYRVGYLELQVIDAPDLQAGYDAATDTYGVAATNAGESIGAIELVIGDDENLELPPGGEWDNAAQHVFSLIDDGTHGTAAARLVHVAAASLSLDAVDVAESYTLTTGQAALMTGYLRTLPTSNLLPGDDIEATCHIQDVPQGTLDFDIDYPTNFSYTTDPPTEIDEVHCFGHINTMNFDVLAGDLPPIFSFEFDPDSHLTILAEDGTGPNSATLGLLAVRLWDNTLAGLPGSGALMGIPLNDARARVDQIPSFHATWSDAAGATAINFNTDANNAFLGGAQVAVSTVVEFLFPLSEATPDSDDYLRFIDEGGVNRKQLTAGAFGIDEFSYTSNDTQLAVHYDADAARQLLVDVDTTFGGRFFPNVAIDATLTVDAIPQLIDLSTDLKSFLTYTASSGIAVVELQGEVDISEASGDPTQVFARIEGIPSSLDVDFDASDGHAHVHANGGVTSVDVELNSNTGIFDTAYKWFLGGIDAIPANWDYDTSFDDATDTTSVSIVATDASAAPAALGTLLVKLSRETEAGSADNLDPFTNINSGMVFRSAFLDVIDDRYFPSSVETRLDDIYGSFFRLDGSPLEDHLIVRQPGDALDYLELQFGGFQSLSATTAPGALNATVNIPTAGTHPFFVGSQSGAEKFELAQIEDIPDTMTVDIVDGDHAHFDASGSPGRIDVYTGPLPMAPEGVDALRAILLNAPSSVHLNYADLDQFPGGASFQASNQFEVRLLTQDSSSRVVAGFEAEDIVLSYGFEFLYDGCDEVAGVDTCLGIFKIGGDINAVGDSSGEGASGFFTQYDLIGSPLPLVGDATAPVGAEYVPRFSALLRDFQNFGMTFEVQLDPLNPIGELFPIDLELEIDGPNFGAGGGFNFDFWDLGFSACLGDTCIIDNPPDYIDNNPWHLVPFFHSPSDHVDPF